jgi:RHS repeat-associated protein
MVVQARHYYSFGMEMSQLNNGTTINKYQYNGKELQDDFGLYWYDYGARFYDPMLGRFHSIDPWAEHYYFNSIYGYAHNNPIRFTDFMGMGPEDEVKKIEPLRFDLKEIFTNALASVGLNPKAPIETTPEKLKETAAHNEKQAEIREEISQTVKEGIKDGAEVVEGVGTGMKAIGYVAAPFTAGESMALVGVGEVLEDVALVANASLDVSNGKYGKAAVDGASRAVFGALGDKVKSAEKAGEFTKESSGILQFFTDAASKFSSTLNNAFSNRNKDKDKN